MDVLRLTLRQLQIFVAVAHSGSTTAASVAIALSQSATSSAIGELERLLSLQLFDRAGKRLLLNDNGRALLPRALAMLDGAAGIEQMAHDGSDQAQSLRIGASTTIGNYVLPQQLGRFLAWRQSDQAAAWQSRVMIGNTAAIARAVADFELDVGLIEGACHEATLQVTPWLQDTLVIVASPAHALAQVAKVSVSALREAVWLLRETGSGTRETTDQALLPHLRSYRRSIELGSSEAIKHAAVQGLGIACLSRWVVEDLIADGRLRCLATPLPVIQRECHLIMQRDKQMTPALLAFIACVTADAGGGSATASSGSTRP
ncbi:LysR family transcriptional regulator [Rhodoferax sp.]|uniref:LysR family transcriptional regulator n=1 Tax=Rhodoferax sp. TaxID=50421 RepID=UPI00374D1F9E